jgi:hypothetical protein
VNVLPPKPNRFAFLKRRWLKLPVWAWFLVAFVLAAVLSDTSTSEVASPVAPDPTFRFSESSDPIENLVWQAEQANPNLAGWQLIEDIKTDDDVIFDDLRFDVLNTADYQDFDTSASLIDVALAIQGLAKSPIQIDFRIDVQHSEVKPDGSIETEMKRREWIEVTGDSKGASVTVDVFGFLPAQKIKLESLANAIQQRYSEVSVKVTDTSRWDD